MTRRSGLGSIFTAMARAAAQERRLRDQRARAAGRAAQAAIRRNRLEQARADRESKLRYAQERQEEADERNTETERRMHDLRGLLAHTLEVDDTVAFASLRQHEGFDAWERREAAPGAPPQREDFFRTLVKPTGLASLFPGRRKAYRLQLAAAEAAFTAASAAWHDASAERRRQFEAKQAQRNAEIDALEAAYRLGDPDAVVAYSTMVLDRSSYPDGFPQRFLVGYSRDSKQLLVEYELPAPDVVPAVASHAYVKSKDEIVAKPRKPAECKALYEDVLAAIALRTLHEVFEADQGGHVDVACFNGFLPTVDPATGHDMNAHLLSVRATREQFQDIQLGRVDKKACLRNLGAAVSPRPGEALPVKPVVEMRMVDPRFVPQQDVLGTLDARPNLLDLTPPEFEALVANLFAKMGLESKLTRTSRDGGVDCVAFDQRPVLGGKVVIQAKRYKNTVEVSAVRDLYGTMLNEGANKGILVTTSGYGPDAFKFAQDKPIELIDGSALLYLLEQNGTCARIIQPAAGVGVDGMARC